MGPEVAHGRARGGGKAEVRPLQRRRDGGRPEGVGVEEYRVVRAVVAGRARPNLAGRGAAAGRLAHKDEAHGRPRGRLLVHGDELGVEEGLAHDRR